jgi:hypothetical protein
LPISLSLKVSPQSSPEGLHMPVSLAQKVSICISVMSSRRSPFAYQSSPEGLFVNRSCQESLHFPIGPVQRISLTLDANCQRISASIRHFKASFLGPVRQKNTGKI